MKKSNALLLSFVLAIAAFSLLYWNGYELRFVPNEPDLRPRLAQPSPLENTEKFRLHGGSERDNRGFPQREIVDLVSMFPKTFFRQGPGKEKRIALTFDDGPDSQYTPQILSILKEHGVKGTFFLIGNRVELFPDVVRRIVREGHVVGNHSMNHPEISKLKMAQTKEEIRLAEEELLKETGYRPSLFRSPYGSLTPEQVKAIGGLGYKIIAWNVDSLDWKSLSAEQVKMNILENVKAGSIVLQHSAGSAEENLTGSVAALKDIIVTLKKEGYQFVTVPQLLDIPYKK